MKHTRLRLTYSTRALAITGTLFVQSVDGKGHDSGLTKVRDGLKALGFTVTNDSTFTQPGAPAGSTGE